jgi:hypothetical protein
VSVYYNRRVNHNISFLFPNAEGPVHGVLPTVHDQETEETQPYAPKAGASSQVWERRGRKKNAEGRVSWQVYIFITLFYINIFSPSGKGELIMLQPCFRVTDDCGNFVRAINNVSFCK